MRFNCEFFNPDESDEKAIREITVALSAAECESVNSIRAKQGTDAADLIAKTYAMSAAYREVPKGFAHTAPPTPVYLS
jgi:hypothetical protein